MTRLLDKALQILVAGFVALMVVVVTWQVISRYLMSDPSPWTEEVARMLLIWVGLLGGVYAYREKAHLGIDLLPQKLGPVGRKRLSIFADLCCGLFAIAVLVVGGSALVQLTWELHQTTAVLGIPMALVYTVLPLSGLLTAWYSFVSIRDYAAVDGDGEGA
jgi:TRAP-type C4-dicarboxylate transport system permease small subunit